MKRGLLITIDGIDGTGKGTLIDRVVDKLEREERVVVKTKEPGGTSLGVGLRQLMFHDVGTKNLAPGVLDLLFLASHMQNWFEIVDPSLREEKIVVCDRWWYSQSAYELHRAVPQSVSDVYDECHGPRADLFIFLHGNPEVMVKRANARLTESHQSGKLWNDAQILGRIQKSYFDLFAKSKEFFPICVDDKSVEQVWLEADHAINVLLMESR